MTMMVHFDSNEPRPVINTFECFLAHSGMARVSLNYKDILKRADVVCFSIFELKS